MFKTIKCHYPLGRLSNKISPLSLSLFLLSQALFPIILFLLPLFFTFSLTLTLSLSLHFFLSSHFCVLFFPLLRFVASSCLYSFNAHYYVLFIDTISFTFYTHFISFQVSFDIVSVLLSILSLSLSLSIKLSQLNGWHGGLLPGRSRVQILAKARIY